MLKRLAADDRIELATEPGFSIGALLVKPAHLRVMQGGQLHPVEPRVMQVLVVLARADGQVVTRDELVDRCWDGRIVGDNALQRVISRLRQIGTATGAFDIEAVTKVGYLLHPTTATHDQPRSGADDHDCPKPVVSGPPEPVSSAPVIARRTVLGVAGLAVAGFATFRAVRPADAKAQSVEQLVEKGRQARYLGVREHFAQSVSYLRQAIALDPAAADAWGALALTYQHLVEHNDSDVQQPFALRAREAADRALALDPGQIEAKVALATIPTYFGAWDSYERRLDALVASERPDPALQGALGWLLGHVGRWHDAMAMLRHSLALEPFQPCNHMLLGKALCSAGRLVEAEQVLEKALSIWPQHRPLWWTRFEFLATTGKPMAAAALVSDADARPLVATDQPPPPYDLLGEFLAVLEEGTESQRDAMAQRLAAARPMIGTNPTVSLLVSLGRTDAAFALLSPYYFGGADRPPPSGLSRRHTDILFSGAGRALRSHATGSAMIDRLGLNAYWKATGRRPDRAI